jgi:hypothetical protein
MNELLFDYLGHFLPCDTCKTNFLNQIRVKTERFTKTEDLFRWLWEVKSAINTENGQPTLSFEMLKKRLELHGRLIDEVALADTLVIMAIFARKAVTNMWADFLQMCSIISRMLPSMNNLSVLKLNLNPDEWTTESVKTNVFEQFIVETAQLVRTKRGGILILEREDYERISEIKFTGAARFDPARRKRYRLGHTRYAKDK